jgi:MoxR-like ATPase
MVLATQNPIEQEGTYPLPEAQLDRFLLKVRIDYPDAEQERALTQRVTEARIGADLAVDDLSPVITPDGLLSLQLTSAAVGVDERVLEYAVAIVRATREHPGIAVGASPRGSIALIRAGRAHALLDGRGFVTPDDVKAIALPALRHRVSTSAEAEIEGLSADTLLTGILDKIPAPRS